MIGCNFTKNCRKYNENTCPLLNGGSIQTCIKNYKISKLQDNALLSEKQRQHIDLRLDEDKCDRDAFIKLKNIENNIINFIDEGKNLYIFSKNVGNGKSSWALRLLNSYFEKIWYKIDIDKCKGLFINVSKFLINLKDSISNRSEYIEHIKNNVLEADVVIWDDVATKGFTQYEMEQIFNLINNRIDEGKTNIYTSNLVGKELQEAIGERLYSRIVNMAEVIEFIGKDKRGI